MDRSPISNSRAFSLARLIRSALSWSSAHRVLALAITTGFLLLLPQLPAQSRSIDVLDISVLGEDQKPLAGATIEGRSNSKLLCKAVTNGRGAAKLSGCGPVAKLDLTASLQGYMSATTSISLKDQGVIEIELLKATTVQQSVVVQGESQSPLTEAKSSESKLPVDNAKLSPLRPNTLADTLPLVPGVIRTSDGRVQITGLDEEHSSLLVNSINVNDPATGDFGLSIPVDTVDVLKVMQSPYLAQYGSFTAGVVSAETRRGGDKLVYSLNDPFPDYRIRSGHLVGVKDASPRLNLSGPVVRNHLYFVEGSEYLLDKAEVRTLPFPVDEIWSTAFNSFTQADAVLGEHNSITSTVHFAPHSVRYADLNYFDPQPVTPNADYHEITGTISEHAGIGGGVLTSSFASTRVATNVTGQQGLGVMVLTPVGNSGNYFGAQKRDATRLQWIETWNPPSVELHGQHAFQVGAVLAHAEDWGNVVERNVTIEGASGQLLRTISYDGNGRFSLADTEPAAYAQDHWVFNSHVAIDTGIRWEFQSLTHTTRLAPRGGLAWQPRKDSSTVVRGGLGVFYDAVPLDTYAFSNYPEQIVTTYDGNGHITDGPRRYLNLTTTAKSEFPFIHQQNTSGNFAPYSVAWNIELEHRFSESAQFRVRYLHSDEYNQLTLQPEITSSWSALVLDSAGELQSRQIDLTVRAGASKQRQFFFSYAHQFARGDITDASSYLGDFPFPVVRSQITASTAGEIPNRFLLWGNSALPWKMLVAPHIEYRDGFTWQPVDQMQNYVDLSSALQPRYPRYFSADARVAKDLKVAKHGIRLSITVRNLTNHTNALQIHNNIADPLYGNFFGNYGRHYVGDFDVLF